MKRNRYLPFGYEVLDGSICISKNEAVIVQSIFEGYKSGLSYQAIADDLKACKVNYLENRYDWNKNRVKRILENRKYLGMMHMPRLIEDELFSEVQELIQNKTSSYRETPSEVIILRKLLCCDVCKRPLSRYITHNRDVWKCENPECRVSVPKRVLEKALLTVQSKITNENDVVKPVVSDHSSKKVDENIAALNESLKSEMNKSNLDEEKIKELIFESAKAVYDQMDDGSNERTANFLKERLSQTKVENKVDYILVTEISSAIYVTRDKSIILKLKSDQTIQ
ncbi:MAG: recombinase family protein [Angelakisella sp.]|nr:recombinase family protein [Angelakisella sp.]